MVAELKRKAESKAADIVNAVVGVALFVSPWALGFVGTTAAAWSAWILGAAMALIALGTIWRFMQWEPWVELALGILAVIAPWGLGFAGVTAALWTSVAAGVIVAVGAAVEIWGVMGDKASKA